MSTEKIYESPTSEVTHLKKVEQELVARLHQQAALAAMGQRALTITDLDVLINESLRLVVDVLDVNFCKILELHPEGEELILRAGVGWQDGLVGSAVVGTGVDSQAGYTLLSNEPVIVEDLRVESRFSGPQLLVDHEIISGISVVIPGRAQPYGVLGVHTNYLRRFTPDDANFLQNVANILASAIVRFRAEKALRTARDQFAIILDGVADGITAQDQMDRLIFANQAASRLFGLDSVRELLNTPFQEVLARFELVNEFGNPFPFEQLPGRLALLGAQSPSATVRFRSKESGEEFWSVVKARPVLNPSGRVEMAVNIFQDITGLKRIERFQRLLAEAGELLSSSNDYNDVLNRVAQLAVGNIADWCAVDLVEENEKLRRVAIAHVDPQKISLARKLRDQYQPDWSTSAGLVKVLRTGRSELYSEIPPELLKAVAHDAEHLRVLHELGLNSAMIVPLVARGRTLGAITLVWAESRLRYTYRDVIYAEELARRAALAIDNARLYREAQQLNADLEARVAKRTAQLQSLVRKLRTEIAERKKAEEGMLKSETLLQSLFESAPDATILLNEGGIMLRVNAQTEAMFGYQRTELLGKSVDILLPARYRERHVKHRSHYLKDPRVRPMGQSQDLYGLRKDGTEFPVDVLLSPVQTEEGSQIIAAIRDITERKQIEADLAEAQRRLVESIETERLFLAQELHDGPMQDLYGISFNLKGFESLLSEASIPEADLSTLSDSRQMLQQVIDILRSISRDLRPPALAPFGLEKAIRAHCEQIPQMNPDLDVKLDLTPDGQMLPEHVRLTLFRIYQHAVSNVLRHAKAKSMIVRFRVSDEDVRLEVEDDGCGFEVPARWVELARDGHLGLVGTAERVKMVGGYFNLRSAPGKGTTIQVSIPRKRIEQLAF